MNSKKFEILHIAQNLSFLCRVEYEIFRFDILQYYRICYYKHLGFFLELFETTKCQILKSSKKGSMELVHQTYFLGKPIATLVSCSSITCRNTQKVTTALIPNMLACGSIHTTSGPQRKLSSES
jgi:hypothetical protein